jgi:preprotein translocase subunit SecA
MLSKIGKILSSFSKEESILKKYKKIAKQVLLKINEIENQSIDKILDYSNSSVLTDKLAAICVASELKLGLKPFEVQIIGVLALIHNDFIEMKTGEGKTLVAGLASCFLALNNKTVYVVTVNDYLAERDLNELKPLFETFNISNAFISNDLSPMEKSASYKSSILYGTNSTFAFDYLKDNLTMNKFEVCQNNMDCVIIDEADSILIDEARTPLIISGPSKYNEEFFIKSFNAAKLLLKEDYELDKENQNVSLTVNGVSHIEKILNIENLYTSNNSKMAHQIQQSLKSIYALRKDVDYMVIDGEVKIIDEYNGRILKDTRYGSGLHQAIEIKENVEIKEENENLAQITYQNYFNLFKHLCGMSGTLKTEKKEFQDIYKKLIIGIPTNKKLTRIDHNDKLFVDEKDKLTYLKKIVKELNEKKIPILIGTLHIEQSEKISKLLSEEGIKHNMLNAKNHLNEAETIQNAGKLGNVTIATNMAGRGVDIKPTQEVLDMGGLYILGFERYQNRRIDNQLIGRAGRQGNSGSSQFLLSLDDEILTFSKDNFLYHKLKEEIEQDTDGVELDLLTKIVSKQQQKIENINFDVRKNMYKYTNILSQQRNNFYEMRHSILELEENDFEPLNNKILNYIKDIYNEKCICNQTDIQCLENNYGLKINIKEEDNLQDKIYEYIKNKIEKEPFIEYELKNIFLENMDSNWREFLNLAELKRKGIHHKQMTNKDPLIEYQLELEKMFNEFINKVKIDIINNIYNYESIEQNPDIEQNDVLFNSINEIQNNFSTFINYIKDTDDNMINLVDDYLKDILRGFIFQDTTVKNNDFNNLRDFFDLDEEELNTKVRDIDNYEESKENLRILILNKIIYRIKIYEDNSNELIKSIILHFTYENIEKFNNELSKILENNIEDKTLEKIEELYFYYNLNIQFDILGNLSYLELEKIEKEN